MSSPAPSNRRARSVSPKTPTAAVAALTVGPCSRTRAVRTERFADRRWRPFSCLVADHPHHILADGGAEWAEHRRLVVRQIRYQPCFSGASRRLFFTLCSAIMLVLSRLVGEATSRSPTCPMRQFAPGSCGHGRVGDVHQPRNMFVPIRARRVLNGAGTPLPPWISLARGFCSSVVIARSECDLLDSASSPTTSRSSRQRVRLRRHVRRGVRHSPRLGWRRRLVPRQLGVTSSKCQTSVAFRVERLIPSRSHPRAGDDRRHLPPLQPFSSISMTRQPVGRAPRSTGGPLACSQPGVSRPRRRLVGHTGGRPPGRSPRRRGPRS